MSTGVSDRDAGASPTDGSATPEHWPGSPRPLGATFDGRGTNFAVFTSSAERVELSLFAEDAGETRVELVEVDAHVWHAYLPGVGPGQRSGFRVHGPDDTAWRRGRVVVAANLGAAPITVGLPDADHRLEFATSNARVELRQGTLRLQPNSGAIARAEVS